MDPKISHFRPHGFHVDLYSKLSSYMSAYYQPARFQTNQMKNGVEANIISDVQKPVTLTSLKYRKAIGIIEQCNNITILITYHQQ